MVRRRLPQQQSKRDRSPGAALGESVPSTPQVGPSHSGAVAASDDAYDGEGGGVLISSRDERDSASPAFLDEGSQMTAAGLAGREDEEEDGYEREGEVPEADDTGAGIVREADPLLAAAVPKPITPTTRVKLNVGGTIFTTFAGTLCKEPSLLSRCVAEGFASCMKDHDGLPYFDRDPSNFVHVLSYLRGYPLLLGSDDALHLAQDAVYFDIQGLRRATGVDPSSISWTFQRGPGVSLDGKDFHSTELVSYLGAGPLLRGETSVVFIKIDKHSQLAVGLVPTEGLPLNAHFGQHPSTICYDSSGEVTCTIITDPPPLPLPAAVALALPRMLSYDASVLLGAARRAGSIGGDGGIRPRGGEGGPNSRGQSPQLLAVGASMGRSSQPLNHEEHMAPQAPTLSLAMTAPRRPPPQLNATATTNGAVPVVMSPYVMPQQHLLQPLTTNSRQPSQLPPMPSPALQTMLPSGAPSPSMQPNSVPDTPQVSPLPFGGPSDFNNAAVLQWNLHSAQQRGSGGAGGVLSTGDVGGGAAAARPTTTTTPAAAAEPAVEDPLALLPLLTSNACATNAAAPNVKEGDELCVVSHLSEDGTCVIVRFYRQQQLLHCVVGFGPPAATGSRRKAVGASRGTAAGVQRDVYRRRFAGIDGFDGSDSDEEVDDGLNNSGGTARDEAMGLVSDLPPSPAIAATQSKADATTAHYPPRRPLPPLQLALYVRSATTVYTSDARSLPAPAKGSSRANNGTQQVGGPPPQPQPPQQGDGPTTTLNIVTQQQQQGIAPPSQQPSTPPPNNSASGTGNQANNAQAGRTTQQLQAMALGLANEAQFELFLSMYPAVSTLLGGMLAEQQQQAPTRGGPPLPTLGGLIDLLGQSLTDIANDVVREHPVLTTNSFYEYFLALPRYFSVLGVSGEGLEGAVTANSILVGDASPMASLGTVFQSALAAAVRGIAVRDTSINGMAHRQVAEGYHSREVLEARRQALHAAAASQPSDRRARRADAGPPLVDIVALFFPDPVMMFAPSGRAPPQQQPQQQQGSGTSEGMPLRFRTARDIANDGR